MRLLPSTKWWFLTRKQVRRLLLQARINVCTAKGLHHRGERSFQPLVLFAAEQRRAAESPAHGFDHAQQRLRFVARKIASFGHIGNEPNGLLELLQAPGIDRIAADEVFAEHPRCPDAELRTAFGIYAIAN